MSRKGSERKVRTGKRESGQIMSTIGVKVGMAVAEYMRQINKRGELNVKVVMGFTVCTSDEKPTELQAYIFQMYVTVSDGGHCHSDLRQLLTLSRSSYYSFFPSRTIFVQNFKQKITNGSDQHGLTVGIPAQISE